MLKPHIYLFRFDYPDGSSWSAWVCESEDGAAFGPSPSDAYDGWVAAMLEGAPAQSDDGQQVTVH